MAESEDVEGKALESLFQANRLKEDDLIGRINFLRSPLNIPNTEIQSENLQTEYKRLCEEFKRAVKSLEYSY